MSDERTNRPRLPTFDEVVANGEAGIIDDWADASGSWIYDVAPEELRPSSSAVAGRWATAMPERRIPRGIPRYASRSWMVRKVIVQ
jgi:hypothetical protein